MTRLVTTAACPDCGSSYTVSIEDTSTILRCKHAADCLQLERQRNELAELQIQAPGGAA